MFFKYVFKVCLRNKQAGRNIAEENNIIISEVFSPMFFVALVTKSKQWNQSKGQSTDEHKGKCGIYTMEP